MPLPHTRLAFSLVCDMGFAVGLAVQYIEKVGHLVWLAEPFFDEEPTLQDVSGISSWRWPVFFPVDAALRKKVITPIGMVEMPKELTEPPVMRGGGSELGWKAVDVHNRILPMQVTPDMPISMVVNDTRLKEMLVTDFRPEDRW